MGVFDKLDRDIKYLINMYTTARQFRNVVKPKEKIVLTSNGMINKVFPFVVNRSLSCEIYLKLIIKNNGIDCRDEHRIKELLTMANIYDDFKKHIMDGTKSVGLKYEEEQLINDLKQISNAFTKWRYAYECLPEGKELYLPEGTLNLLNDYLDTYCKKLILDKTGIDMEKYTYI